MVPPKAGGNAVNMEKLTGGTAQWSADTARQKLSRALMEECPSLFFAALRENDELNPWFQEVSDLIGVEQSPVHHAEGDVWNHTMMVLDQAAKTKHKAQDPLSYMLGALTHDFGKVICTQVIEGRICSYEHEIKGLPLVKSFLQRLEFEPVQIERVLELVRYHMQPNALAAQNSSIKATNRLFDQVSDPMALICLAVADGRGKESTLPYVSYEDFLMQRLAVYREYLMRPGVTREELAAQLPPNADLDECMAFAHKLQLAGVDHKCALSQTLGQARRGMVLGVRSAKTEE